VCSRSEVFRGRPHCGCGSGRIICESDPETQARQFGKMGLGPCLARQVMRVHSGGSVGIRVGLGHWRSRGQRSGYLGPR